MASITCKCGNRLSNSSAPNDIQYHVYSDREWDKILEHDFIEMIKFPVELSITIITTKTLLYKFYHQNDRCTHILC